VTETVPADIAAAIEKLIEDADDVGASKYVSPRGLPQAERDLAQSRAALEAAILTHLRKADELKAALELQTYGGA
jgi:hypothetical protein